MMETTVTTSEEPAAVEYSFEFRGNTGEFFKIWAVNMILTFVTLGVFSAWAKVRTKRYFNGNTFLNGNSFGYHANPLTVLVARVLVLGIIVAVTYWSGDSIWKNSANSTWLALFLPWAYARGIAFNARHTSFLGLRFSFCNFYPKIYFAYLPLIIAGLVPSYYLAFNFSGDLADIPEELMVDIVLLINLMVGGGVILLSPMMARALHRYKVSRYSYGYIKFKPDEISIWSYCFPIGFFWDDLNFSGGRIQSNVPMSKYAVQILLVNLFAIPLSLGILYPWAKIRRARFLAKHIKVIAVADIWQKPFTRRVKKTDAVGEELVSTKEFEFDIGII